MMPRYLEHDGWNSPNSRRSRGTRRRRCEEITSHDAALIKDSANNREKLTLPPTDVGNSLLLIRYFYTHLRCINIEAKLLGSRDSRSEEETARLIYINTSPSEDQLEGRAGIRDSRDSVSATRSSTARSTRAPVHLHRRACCTLFTGYSNYHER